MCKQAYQMSIEVRKFTGKREAMNILKGFMQNLRVLGVESL